MIQDRIYSHYKRELEPNDLFLFDSIAAISLELVYAEWANGYVYKEFDNQRPLFTTTPSLTTTSLN